MIFFDAATNTHLFIAQEDSDDCLRCCCNPYHSHRIQFKVVNAGDRQWSTRANILSMPTVMHAEREGCCSKPCLGCWVCSDSCKDGIVMNAGTPAQGTEPGSVSISDATFSYATQPKCGGYFTPSLNIFHRATAGDKESGFAPLAKVEGPCIFGGCSELCCESEFKVSAMSAEQIDASIKTGDLATITKKKPRDGCACAREVFTDSDTFQVTFKEDVGLTPQQKASFMASMILTDFMFFEGDHGMCDYNGDAVIITLCYYYCCGCACPCNLIIPTKYNGAPETQEMER